MSTITNEQQALIASKLAGMHLPSGLGDEQSACSIAAINLALSGRLTDSIPDCMSEVIGRWIIVTQDAMPDGVRNSKRWKSLLPLAAGTGRDREQARLDIILDWMWEIVLPSLQPLADQQGFGAQWQKMTTDRTPESANAAAHRVARRVAESSAFADLAAHRVATAAANAAEEAEWAAGAAARATEAAGAAAEAAAAEAAAAVAAEVAAEVAEAWANFDPCALLERLVGTGSPIKIGGL
jgi:hypothetical protein